MITIEEAIQSNDKVIGICMIALAILSFAALWYVFRCEAMTKKRIRKAVAKAEADTRAECRQEYHDKNLDNFMEWMDARIELKKTKAELNTLRKKYDMLYQAAEGCPGVTRAKIIENRGGNHEQHRDHHREPGTGHCEL